MIGSTLRNLVFVTLLTNMAVPVSADSVSHTPYPQFSAYANVRTIDIQFTDWDIVLEKVVLDGGRSDRNRPARPSARTGQRVIRGIQRSTRFEGNRIYLPAFRDKKNFEILVNIRKDMERAPSIVAMKEWTRNQQLAYWLNLYNIGIVEQLSRHYPKITLRTLLYGDEGILEEKFLNVAGTNLSLQDIHHDILIRNWRDPLIMYGLFHGYIGSANITTKAYTPNNVYEMLRENAEEFINSNRGTRFRRNTLRVSELYILNKALFPNWETDLVAHLKDFSPPSRQGKFVESVTVKATLNDYNTADLFQGIRSDETSGSYNGDIFIGTEYESKMALTKNSRLNLPRSVLAYLRNLKKKRAEREGTVEIEEIQD